MFYIFYSPLTYQNDMCEVIGDPVDHHKYPLNGVDRKQKRNKAIQRWDKHFGLGFSILLPINIAVRIQGGAEGAMHPPTPTQPCRNKS